MRLLAVTGPNRGIVSVSIDGGVPVDGGYVFAGFQLQQVVFEATGLAAGSHTLSVVNTGTKNALSSGTWVDLDAVEAEALTPAPNTDPTIDSVTPGERWPSSRGQLRRR